MSNFDWPKYLKECLESTQFMALATNGQAGVWNHAVFFAYDNQLNFYFISQPHSRHMQNISRQSEVALAIFSTSQSPVGNVAGLQVQGTAIILPDDEVAAAHAIYYQRSPRIPGIPDQVESYLGNKADWKFVKVTPNEVGYFDTRFFDDRQIVASGITL